MISVQKKAPSDARKQIMPHCAGCSVFSGLIGGGPSRPATLSMPGVPSWAGGAGAVSSFTPRPSAHSYSYFQSGSSGCLRSHSGRRLYTVGISSKLYDGGGEEVAHSSVQASHGLSPAGLPLRPETIRFQ